MFMVSINARATAADREAPRLPPVQAVENSFLDGYPSRTSRKASDTAFMQVFFP